MKNNTTIQERLIALLKDKFKVQDISSDSALITGGILDSIDVLKFVDLVETEFQIAFEPFEITEDNLDNIPSITDFISSKHTNDIR